jgi:TonB family protein
MDTRTHVALLLSALLALSGCAGAMGPRGVEHPKPKAGDVYAAGDESPTDIYRSWYLFNQLAGSASVEGELRLADLSQWRHDEYRSAYYWYRRAAAQGDGIAAANLWYLYTTHAASGSDNPEAAGYYELATDSDAGQRQLYALKTKMAIDSRREYPSAAGGEQGTAIVEFDRADDGKVTDVKLYRSSGSQELDSAAIAAVQNADLPAIPAALDGFRHFIISVRFAPNLG